MEQFNCGIQMFMIKEYRQVQWQSRQMSLSPDISIHSTTIRVYTMILRFMEAPAIIVMLSAVPGFSGVH
jgi:hypothetical protein